MMVADWPFVRSFLSCLPPRDCCKTQEVHKASRLKLILHFALLIITRYVAVEEIGNGGRVGVIFHRQNWYFEKLQ